MTVRQDKVHTHTFGNGQPVAVCAAHTPFEYRKFCRTVPVIA